MNHSQAQDDYLCDLCERVKKNYDSDLLFYEIVERVSKQRTITGLTKTEASAVIDTVKQELL